MDALRALRAAFGASRMTSGLCAAPFNLLAWAVHVLVPHIDIVSNVYDPHLGQSKLVYHTFSDRRL